MLIYIHQYILIEFFVLFSFQKSRYDALKFLQFNPNLVLFSRLNKDRFSGDFSFVLEEADIYIHLINVSDISDVNFFVTLICSNIII